MPNFFSKEHSLVPYQAWGLGIVVKWKEGKIQIPIAEAPNEAAGRSSSGPCEIVRKHAPFGTLVVTFHAERMGDWPVIPDPGPRDANLELDDVTWHVAAPMLMDSGNIRVYAVAGQYNYFLKRPLWGPSSGLFGGWNPIDSTPFFFLSAQYFEPLV